MEHLADSAVYSDEVLGLFDAPPHAGRPAGANRSGSAESKPRASRVMLHLKMSGETVEAAGFEALACPHTIAAAERVCQDLEGRGLAELAGYTATFLDELLPAEKLDIRIMLEDAVRNTAAGGD